MYKTILFNDNWKFAKMPMDSHINDNMTYEDVEIPHDFLIYNTNDLYETCTGFYKKEFYKNENYKNVFLRFDGVYMDTYIYVNNTLAGQWKNGYTTFEIDITPYIITGLNNLIVKVIHQSPNSRWYSGAGIYRNVYIKYKDKSFVKSDSLYISTYKINSTWEVKINAIVERMNNLSLPSIKTEILDTKGKVLSSQINTMTMKDSNFTTNHYIDNPNVWDINTPYNLYNVQLTLLDGETIIDVEKSTLGFRTIEFHSEKGFLLNNRVVKIQGVCQHHDLGAIGSAHNTKALKRQLEKLKEMGVNGIRTAHNPPSKELMELADKMGFLVCSEALDMWQRSKTPYDFARFFDEWVEKDFESWITRDRNHPSLILWSIGNEIYDTHIDEKGIEITEKLINLVKKFDYNNNAYATIGSNYMPWENAQKCADIIKIAGYNYGENFYKKHHNQYKDWVIYGSETSSIVQSRGIYHFPLNKSLLSDDDRQCSSLGNSATSWGAKSMEKCIIDHRDNDFVFGQFIWTGTDYIGEPTPYSTKNSYFGQIDTAGFPKDSFYFYQSQWTSYITNPMIHIYPYWDFSPNQLIDVCVCSNAPIVQLFFNENSLGKVKLSKENGTNLIGKWQIPYNKGTLKAIGYDENNNIISIDEKKSFGSPKKIYLHTSNKTILANGEDLAFIEINMLDENNNIVENANNRVYINVTGEGRLIGIDNGDSTDFDQFKGNTKRLFSGKLLAIIAPTYKSGVITIDISSYGLKNASITIQSVECKIKEGVSTYLMNNYKSNYINEIPVRKIQLTTCNNVIDKNNPTTTIKAEIFPENCSYKDLIWRLTNDAGIDSNIASYDMVSNNEIIVNPISDGKLYVRCGTKNGDSYINLYSHIELKIKDFGQTLYNPYKFISAGLYNKSNVELTNGNCRGVASLRDGESHIGFSNVDFGEYGSDEITIPIFAMDQTPFSFEIWEGMPNDSLAKKICTLDYNYGSQWNVYKDITYKLPRKLNGVTTIAFLLKRKIHIKGFIFKKYEKALEKLYVALDNDNVYGDIYEIKDKWIKNIGNNVTITFNNMNFVTKINSIEINGKTNLDINTIHIKFSNDTESFTEIIDFRKSVDNNTQNFIIRNIIGNYKVEFVFLPGSSFDFQWFQFL